MRATAWVVACWLMAAAAAQETRPSEAEQALRKAVLIEEAERDLPGAVKAYRALIDDVRTPAVLRTRALLRLGLLLQRLGRMEEAKAVLTQAVSGEGDAAQEAKDVLAGKRPAAEEQAAANVRLRVTILISALHAAKTDQEMEEPGKELLWIGKPAVPHLADAIATSASADFRLVAILSAKVAVIGGPDAVKLFASMAQAQDPLSRRACLRMLPALSNAPMPGLASVPPEVAEALRTFLDDSDAAVRLDALRAFQPGVTDLLRMSRDVEPAIRRATRRKVEWWLTQRKPTAAEMDQLIEIVRAGIDDPDAEVRQASWQLMNLGAGTPTLASGHPSTALNRFCSSLAPRREVEEVLFTLVNLDYKTGADAALLLSTAQAIEQTAAAHERRRRWLSQQIANIANEAPWRQTELPQVVRLIELGYNQASQWLFAHAQAQDAATMAGLVGRLEPPDTALAWLSKQGVRTLDVCTPVLAWLEERLKKNDGYGEHFARLGAQFLAPAADPAVHQRLVALAEARPPVLLPVAQEYLEVQGPAATGALAQLVVKGPKFDRNESQVRTVRARIVARLIREGVPDLADTLAHVYLLGHARFTSEPPQANWNKLDDSANQDTLRALWWLTLVDTRRGRAPLHPYPPDVVAALAERCLTAGGAEPWQDLNLLLQEERRTPPADWRLPFAVAVPPPVAEVACRLVLDAPVNQELRFNALRLLLAPVTPPIPGAEALLTRALAADPETQAVALKARSAAFVPSHLPILAALLGSPDATLVSNAAEQIVALRTSESAAALVPLLQSPRPELRVVGVSAIATAAPGRRWELIAPLLVDPERGVRSAACDTLKDVEEVPAAIWPHVKAALASKDPDAVEVAIRAAFRTGSPEAGAALVPLLRHAERAVRIAAAGTLARHQPQAAIEQLGALLREPLPKTWRADTCDALGLTLDPKAAMLLVPELRHQEEDVRGAARHALQAIAFYRDQQERWK
jgi:HEAT repeat protein